MAGAVFEGWQLDFWDFQKPLASVPGVVDGDEVAALARRNGARQGTPIFLGPDGRADWRVNAFWRARTPPCASSCAPSEPHLSNKPSTRHPTTSSASPTVDEAPAQADNREPSTKASRTDAHHRCHRPGQPSQVQ